MEYVTQVPPDEWNALIAEIATATGKRYRELKAMANRWIMPELLSWGRRFLPHYLTQAPSKMHLSLIGDLQWRHKDRNVKQAVIAPRGGAKTTWVSKIYTLYAICHNLERHILLIADASDQAVENLEAVRHELESNEALEREYPEACGPGPTWNMGEIVTRNGIKVRAAGTRKKVRGRGHRADRPTLIIVDDLENDEAVQSPDQRAKTMNWLQRALIPAGSPTTNILFIGTALHPDDALQNIRNQPGWRFKSYSALVREPLNQTLWDEWRRMYRNVGVDPVTRERTCREFYDAHPEMNDGAELLWPEREPLYDLMCWRETNGERAFQAEKQGNAAATGATEFGSELFSGSIWFDVWPDLQLKAMALDPSKGSNEKNDYSAYVWGGLAEDGNIYVDADLERRDASKVVSDGIRLYRQFLPQMFGLETVMFLQLFANIFELEARRQGILLPITPINPHEQKLVRIRQLTPYLKAGRIKFRAGSRGAEMLVDQLKWFPTGRHDDGPDALHMMFELLLSLSGSQGQSNDDGGGSEIIVT